MSHASSPRAGSVINGGDTQGLTFLPLIQRIEAPEKLKAVKEGVRMAKDLSELKDLIVDIEKVQ
jgi:hypothetical protein